MNLSIYRPAFLLRPLSKAKAMLSKRLSSFALLLAACGMSVTQADATFTYELSGPDDTKTVKQFSTARFFVRIDDPSEAKQFLLFQAGKFFPMYAVDEAESTYTLLTPPVNSRLGGVSRSKPVAQVTSGEKEDEQADQKDADNDSQQQASAAQPVSAATAEVKPETVAEQSTEPEAGSVNKQETPPPEPAAQPEAAVTESEMPAAEATGGGASPVAAAEPGGRWPTVKLKASKKKATVAGIRCRVVRELVDGEPVMEHCMANSAALGVTKREVITLSRLFAMARKKEFNWLGVGTKDEEFISVQSRDLRDNTTLKLTSVSTKPLPAGYLRIPRSFKRVDSEAKTDSDTSDEKLH